VKKFKKLEQPQSSDIKLLQAYMAKLKAELREARHAKHGSSVLCQIDRLKYAFMQAQRRHFCLNRM